MSQQIINGDSAEVLKQFKDNSIDAVITDPPYGIEFLGKEWDRNTGAVEIWQECLRVLKPGGYLLAFSAARTYHNLATNIEGVGFDIRDQIMWIYASGFPKAQDIGKAIQRRQGVERHEVRDVTDGYNIKNQRSFSENNDVPFERMKPIAVPTSPEAKQWSGWKTALKPAHEPIVMARKPFRGSTIDNVLTHGVGALNIDATRIAYEGEADMKEANVFKGTRTTGMDQYCEPTGNLDKDKEKLITGNTEGRYPSNVLGDIPDYQKYFYSPKVSRKERHRGFEQHHIPTSKGGILGTDGDWSPEHWHGEKGQKNKGSLSHIPTNPAGMYDVDGTGVQYNPDKKNNVGNNAVGKIETGLTDKNGNVQTFTSDPATHNVGNNHPTVKPVALMRYLVQLVTPQGAHVMDPFSGSGSTGMACRELARQFTGIDLDNNYCEIARKRIQASTEDKSETLFE